MERKTALCWLLIIFIVALMLRLVVWRWHEFYPLGGDEQEYFDQALTLLREYRYVELRLMRPPLYGVFLAGCIVLVDSLVQNLRLVQAIISALTVLPVWLLTAEVVAARGSNEDTHPAPERSIIRVQERFAPPAAALLCALSYTLASYATELLTETVFLFGLTVVLWLLVRVRNHMPSATISACLAGLVLGTLCLTRSVALVLLPLGVLWLLPGQRDRRAVRHALIICLTTALVILPWSVRNHVTYGSVIVIDTTGAENLWLDNDPAGREAVKAQLYALGDDRALRQQLATRQGIAAIRDHPAHFLSKVWGELLTFFALEYTDDMRARRAIWVPPAEVGARLLLGDGLWLVLLLCGTAGLWQESRRVISRAGSAHSGRDGRSRLSFSPVALLRFQPSPALLFTAWGLYILLTALVFHVELRYRLPLYPVLLPYAAITLVTTFKQLAHRPHLRTLHLSPLRIVAHPVPWIICLILLHQPYPLLVWQLGWKHLHLARAEYALAHGNSSEAWGAAQAALHHDTESALARVAQARSLLLNGHTAEAETILHEAIALQPAHPHAHLLLGDVLRQQGNHAAARSALTAETHSLQDLQVWSWQRFTTPPTTTLEIGDGLDLGFVRGFYSAEHGELTTGNWRWTSGTAQVRLALPVPPAELHTYVETATRSTTLRLRLASGRPAGMPAPLVQVVTGSQVLGQFEISSDWRTYRLLLPDDCIKMGENQTHEEGEGCVVILRSETFKPRSYDRSSSDGRVLGVMIDHIQVNQRTH